MGLSPAGVPASSRRHLCSPLSLGLLPGTGRAFPSSPVPGLLRCLDAGTRRQRQVQLDPEPWVFRVRLSCKHLGKDWVRRRWAPATHANSRAPCSQGACGPARGQAVNRVSRTCRPPLACDGCCTESRVCEAGGLLGKGAALGGSGEGDVCCPHSMTSAHPPRHHSPAAFTVLPRGLEKIALLEFPLWLSG